MREALTRAFTPRPIRKHSKKSLNWWCYQEKASSPKKPKRLNKTPSSSKPGEPTQRWSQRSMAWRCMVWMSARTTASPASSAMWRWRWWPETSTGLVRFCGKGIKKHANSNSRAKAGAMTNANNAVCKGDRTSLQRKSSISGDQMDRFTVTPGIGIARKSGKLLLLQVRRKHGAGFRCQPQENLGCSRIRP